MNTKQEAAYQDALVFGWEYSHREGERIVMQLHEYIHDSRLLIAEAEIMEDGSRNETFRATKYISPEDQ